MDETTMTHTNKQDRIMRRANAARAAMVADEMTGGLSTRYVEREQLDMWGKVRQTPEAPFDINNLPDLEMRDYEPIDDCILCGFFNWLRKG